METTMGWNEERVELLKKLWTEGLSASQIAGRLGQVTRNAVIGKVHRLGLSGSRQGALHRSSAAAQGAPGPDGAGLAADVARQHGAGAGIRGRGGKPIPSPMTMWCR